MSPTEAIPAVFLPSQFHHWAWRILSTDVPALAFGLLMEDCTPLPRPKSTRDVIFRTLNGSRIFLRPIDALDAEPITCELFYVDDLRSAQNDLTAMELHCSEIFTDGGWGDYFAAVNDDGKRFYVYRLNNRYRP